MNTNLITNKSITTSSSDQLTDNKNRIQVSQGNGPRWNPLEYSIIIPSVLQDYQLDCGNTIIKIAEGCRDIEIQFPEDHYFPIITSSDNNLIILREKNGLNYTLNAIEILRNYMNKQYKFLSGLALLIKQYPDLIRPIACQADFCTFLSLTMVCKAFYKALSDLRLSRLNQEAMVTLPLGKLMDTQEISDTAQLESVLRYTGIPKHTTITLNDLQKPSEFLIKALKSGQLSLTLEIKKSNELDALITFISLSESKIWMLNHLKHLRIQLGVDAFIRQKLIVLSGFNNALKQLTKLSLGCIYSVPNFSLFENIKYLHMRNFKSAGDLELPSSITHLSFGDLDQALDLASFLTIENISIASTLMDCKLICKNGMVVKIERGSENISILLKDGLPNITGITSKDNKKITLTYEVPQ